MLPLVNFNPCFLASSYHLPPILSFPTMSLNPLSYRFLGLDNVVEKRTKEKGQ